MRYPSCPSAQLQAGGISLEALWNRMGQNAVAGVGKANRHTLMSYLVCDVHFATITAFWNKMIQYLSCKTGALERRPQQAPFGVL